MKFNPMIIPSSAWHKPTDILPQPMTQVIVSDGHGICIAVWHKSIGKGGDFATTTKRGKYVTLNHLPDVMFWTPAPQVPQIEK